MQSQRDRETETENTGREADKLWRVDGLTEMGDKKSENGEDGKKKKIEEHFW
jgi:hypothetical protein